MTPNLEKRASIRITGPACAHCGLEVPKRLVRDDDGEQFCCAGCRQVYQLIHGWGFDGFYRLASLEGSQRAPAQVTGRTFEDFDDPAFQERNVTSTPQRTLQTRLYLEGVHCAACVWLVEEMPRVVEGLISVRLNLATSIAEVEWDPQSVSLSKVAQALDTIGYTPHNHSARAVHEAQQRADRSLLIKIGVASMCAMNIMFIHGALYAGEYHGIAPAFASFFRWMSLLLSLPVILYAAQPFFRAAWAGLRQRVPHMDLPISIALLVAFLFSAKATIAGSGPVYFDSLAALVGLLLGARYMQQRAQRRALARSENLRSVAFVEFARRLDSRGLSQEVPASTVRCGERVEVRSGELLPVDGIVVDGRSAVNNAVLTGEAKSVAVAPGDFVYAGATNIGARIVVDVAAAGGTTRVGGLLALVDKAMAKRAPLVQLADRISRYFVLVVLALAVATGGFVWVRSGGSVDTALQHVVALLVVTCPCALGLATPVAITVGLSRAAHAGIFIKNPDIIERMASVGCVLLDKTGTLTQGIAKVTQWHGPREVRDLAFALELDSVHPIAQAFRRSLECPVRAARKTEDVRETPGQGIVGRIDGRAVAVGNQALMAAMGSFTNTSLSTKAEEFVASGWSPVFVSVDGHVAGVAGIGDPLRDDARDTVQTLIKRGIRPRILSGDHPHIVGRIAAELGMPPEDAIGGMSPEDKLEFVTTLGERLPHGQGVMMVGDGVNDAAALAQADVGVAVQGGTGASIVAADVILTRPGLAPLLDLYVGSRRVLGVVRRNLLFSLAYNMVGASLAIAGFVGPLLAAVLMPLSSLTVILSSAVGRTFVAPCGARQPRSRRPPKGA